MNTARLNKRVTLQQRQSGKGGLGQAVGGWVDVMPLWAEIKPVAAVENVESGAVRASITHDVRIHYRVGVTARMRFVRSGRVLEIIEAPINEFEKGRYLLCKCREVPSG